MSRATIRLTMAQAVVRWLTQQHTVIDSAHVPQFAGVFGIFGYVNQLDIGWMNLDHERPLVLREAGDPEFIDRADAAKPFGRILDPKEVARAILWMASDDSGMMTGAVIPFDQLVYGGYDDAPAPAAKRKA